MIIDGGKRVTQAPNHKPSPVTLPVNRCPARPRASGPPGESLCNQHSNSGTYETQRKGCYSIHYRIKTRISHWTRHMECLITAWQREFKPVTQFILSALRDTRAVQIHFSQSSALPNLNASLGIWHSCCKIYTSSCRRKTFALRGVVYCRG